MSEAYEHFFGQFPPRERRWIERDVPDKDFEGDVVKAKVLEVDKQGRIRLSMKAVEEGEGVSG